MTLENCKRLLTHYQDIGDETNTSLMKAKIAHKMTLPKYATKVKETTPKVKDGKK